MNWGGDEGEGELARVTGQAEERPLTDQSVEGRRDSVGGGQEYG